MLPCSPRTGPYVHANAYGSYLRFWRQTVNTACRTRSAACDTLSRLCVRHVLWLHRFPLVAALPSFDSAETRASLFAAFNSTMAASDCFTRLIIRFGIPPFFQRPCQSLASLGKALPSPDIGHAHIHWFIRHHRARLHLTISVPSMLPSTR